MAHAFLSPSGAPAWLRCHAKVWREKGLPDESSEFADEGTAAHFLRDQCLINEVDTSEYIGKYIAVMPDGATWMTTSRHSAAPNFLVDADMAREVQKSIDVIRAFGGEMYAERKLNIGFITGEEGATGTVDTTIVKTPELIIDDLKYGRGIAVDSVDNEQLLIYGAAALEEFDLLGEIETLRMRISQPRINNDSEWVLPVSEVRERVIEIRKVADKIMAGPEGLEATPGDKQCRFCKVKGTCPEYRASVLAVVADDFIDLSKGEIAVGIKDAESILAQAYGVKLKAVDFERGDENHEPRFVVKKPNLTPQLSDAETRLASTDDEDLATCMDAVDTIESWCKAVRAEVERRLLAGKFTDARYKLVDGRAGARAWSDEQEAETLLKSFRLKQEQMYEFKLISPTTAEKVLAEASPKRWAKAQALISRSDGKPSVAPVSDKRPALVITPVEDDFADLTAQSVDDLV
jgi:hypothetical protein